MEIRDDKTVPFTSFVLSHVDRYFGLARHEHGCVSWRAEWKTERLVRSITPGFHRSGKGRVAAKEKAALVESGFSPDRSAKENFILFFGFSREPAGGKIVSGCGGEVGERWALLEMASGRFPQNNACTELCGVLV